MAKKHYYSYKEYEHDVTTTSKMFTSVVVGIKKNNDILILAQKLLDKNTTLDETERQDVQSIISSLAEMTHSTIDHLEKIKLELLAVPNHFEKSNVKVDEWMFRVTGLILEHCSWVGELTEPYIAVFDVLGMDEAITSPEILSHISKKRTEATTN